MADIKSLQAIAQANGKRFESERLLFQLLDFQNKNSFDVIFYPTYFPKPSLTPSSIITTAKWTASTAMDQVVTRLNIRSISIPFFNTLEMENADGEQYVKALTRATEVTFKFVEVEQALIVRYFQMWNDLIYFYDTSKKTYIFRDDQYAAKKNCKIMMNTGLGIPSNALITITGMRPKSTGELSLDHDESEPYMPEVIFHCDRIQLFDLVF
jgi:hypothetical protein